MTDRKKVIFNYLPPAIVNTPSIAFTLLKGFLVDNGIESEIIYWNIYMSKIMGSYSGSKKILPDLFQLFPFLSVLSNKYGDNIIKNRLISLMQSTPELFEFKERKLYEEFLNEINKNLYEIINNKLDKINFEDVILFGISSKFYQWIPGILLAEEIKKRNSNTKIVLGGFGNKESAISVLHTSEYFDFAIWGEGEYPLLELTNILIENKENHIPKINRVINRKDNTTFSKDNLDLCLDLNYYTELKYDDFFNTLSMYDISTDRIPIEGSRSCNWNRCKFCVLNEGYKYRDRSPENIVKEMVDVFSKYNIKKFFFSDNNVVGRNLKRYHSLLELIIDAAKQLEIDFDISAELIPYKFDSEIIKKMSHAGFRTIQIGYESLSDNLLKIMGKKTLFADNLLFVKFALKYRINIIGVNVITGIPEETEEEIINSIENLHFLRFYLYNSRFSHQESPLHISVGSKYYNSISENKKTNWNLNDIKYLITDSFGQNENRFNLFQFSSLSRNRTEWNNFWDIEKQYRENQYIYSLTYLNDLLYYEEYLNNEKINSIIFNEQEYIDVLIETNDRVVSIRQLFDVLKKKYHDITITKLEEIIKRLNEQFLLYYSSHFQNIVSIIDIKTIS